ncbi:hypothetical protein Tco_0320784, partial [Tanacetum coccineum]
TDAEQRRPTIKKLEVKLVEFKLGEDCWEKQVNWSIGQLDVVFDGAFGGVGDEEVVVREGVVVISLSLDILTNSCLGGIMVSLIFLEGLDEEAFMEFIVE